MYNHYCDQRCIHIVTLLRPVYNDRHVIKRGGGGIEEQTQKAKKHIQHVKKSVGKPIPVASSLIENRFIEYR